MTSTSAPKTPASAGERLRRWLPLPAGERFRRLVAKVPRPAKALRRLAAVPFRFGFGSLGDAFLAYHPDSHLFYDAYPEYRTARGRFIRGCRIPNAGDSVRLWTLILNIRQVLDEGVAGQFAELGVFRGNTAAVLAEFASQAGRRVQLFDTFEGFDRRDLEGVDAGTSRQFHDTGIGFVRAVIGPSAEICDFVPGYFPDSLRPEHESMRYAVVSLDCDLYKPMKAGLEYFYPRLSVGGILFIHDYSSRTWKGVKQAVDEFTAVHGERPVLVADKSGTVIIRRSR
jgi:hypothetical protein